jgi:hypothetical protein
LLRLVKLETEAYDLKESNLEGMQIKVNSFQPREDDRGKNVLNGNIGGDLFG